MPRVKGNSVPLFTLKIGASAAVDFGGEMVSFEFVDGDGAQTTFADYAAGTPTQLNVTSALNFDATSLFEYLYANSGTTGVIYTLQYRNAAASQSNPKFTGTLTLPPQKPRWGNSAGESTEDATFDVEFDLDTYTKVIS